MRPTLQDSSASIANEMGDVESSASGASSKNQNGRFYKGLPSGGGNGGSGGDTYDDSTNRAAPRQHSSTSSSRWFTVAPLLAAVVSVTLARAVASVPVSAMS